MQIEIIKTIDSHNPLTSTQEFGLILLKATSTLHMIHWYVTDYNIHKIIGNLYEDLDGLFDKLQEEIIGIVRSNQITFPQFNCNIPAFDVNDPLKFDNNDNSIVDFYYQICVEITSILTCIEFNNFVSQAKTGIHNTVEEIISRFNKTSYLLSLVK